VLVRIDESGADDERLDELTSVLSAELLSADVDDVARVSEGDAPPGARAADFAAIGALLVTLQTSIAAVHRMVAAVRSWLARGSTERSAELVVGDVTLRLTGSSSEQQNRLIEEFVRAVATRVDPVTEVVQEAESQYRRTASAIRR
jgi:hypothetical protein